MTLMIIVVVLFKIQTTKIDINKFWDALHKCIETQHQEGHDLSKDPEL